MNLSSFAIGAFLSHAAKAHGDMGGTKHLHCHYRRLSSAGLLLSSLLLAPTATAQNGDDRTVTFSTRIGNCDVNDELFEFPPVFPLPRTERCLAAEDPMSGLFAPPVYFAVPAPQVLDIDVFGDLGNDNEYADGFTLEVEGPCTIEGLPNQLGECGLVLNANGGFGQGQLFDSGLQLYNPDNDISVEIMGNDSNQLKDDISICYVPTEDTEPGSSLAATCTIKVSRPRGSTRTRNLCLPPEDYGDNCLRDVNGRYFTQDERINSRSAIERSCNIDGQCQLGRCECTRPNCGAGCGPPFCGCPGFPFPADPNNCDLTLGTQLGPGGVPQPEVTCPTDCTESTSREDIACEEVTSRVPDGSVDTFTTVVEIDTSGNNGECGDGFCINGVDKNCRDCRRERTILPIAPEDTIPPYVSYRVSFPSVIIILMDLTYKSLPEITVKSLRSSAGCSSFCGSGKPKGSEWYHVRTSQWT